MIAISVLVNKHDVSYINGKAMENKRPKLMWFELVRKDRIICNLVDILNWN